SANSFAGIAVSSYTVDATKGNWQYSTNGGSSWTALASATTIAAITLNGSDLDGSVASFKITSLPVHGTLSADAGLTDTLLVGESVTATGNAATVYFK